MSKLLLGRYELMEKIGEGGMAVVYKSRDRLLNRHVAIKILRPEYTKDAQFLDSFRRESQAAAGLQHPNIVSVYDVGREGNINFIVMELVDGKPLSDIIHENAPMDYKDVIEVGKQVASALSLAHRHNIIHRDVKPHNIMITSDGIAKLTDFGIAKAISDSTLTDTSKIIGSVHYFSPEQARGAYVDERSDIYSLGIVLYEMLTGDVPFDGENPVQVALMHINDDINPPSELVSGVPPALERLVMKATDKYQSNRYASADELLKDLENVRYVSDVIGEEAFAGKDENRKTRQVDPVKMAKSVKPKKTNNKKSNKKLIIAIVAAIAAVAALFGLLYASALIGKADVKIPDLTDMSYSQAKSNLKDIGLKIKKGDTVASDDVEKGKIADQDPPAGVTAKKGDTITVNLSSGPGTETVPDLIGSYYDQNQTKAYLKDNGNFKLGTVSEAKSDKYEKGQIISQNPAAGSTVEKGATIDITVCSGKKTEKVTVPSLTGLTIDGAREKLNAVGLRLGRVTYTESDIYSKGYVIWQQYESGSQLKKGSFVSLRVSKGSPDTGSDEQNPESGSNQHTGENS